MTIEVEENLDKEALPPLEAGALYRLVHPLYGVKGDIHGVDTRKLWQDVIGFVYQDKDPNDTESYGHEVVDLGLLEGRPIIMVTEYVEPQWTAIERVEVLDEGGHFSHYKSTYGWLYWYRGILRVNPESNHIRKVTFSCKGNNEIWKKSLEKVEEK